MVANIQDASFRKSPDGVSSPARRGRPRSDRADRAILQSAQDLLIQNGYADLRLEHVAARAGVGKATLYRRWKSREALVLSLLMDLAAPHIGIDDSGDTRAELLAAVTNAMHAVVDTPFGPVIRRRSGWMCTRSATSNTLGML